jgi:uncharacterized protein (DUF302 family)
MYYIADSDKSFEQACISIESAVTRHDFSVLHVHDLGKTLRAKGTTFAPQCKIFEVCHPQQAANVLSADMLLNMVLPCRISVYTDQGKTKIGLVKPTQMLAALSDNPSLKHISEEVESRTIQMVDQAK